ncbi:MAG: hypothetical protein RL698_1361 [Pseudomonadota bacterium]|jgi:heptosyltransferase III
MKTAARWSQSPFWQRTGKRIGRAGRHLSNRAMGRILPLPLNRRIEDLPPVHSVLLVRPNIRIGNTILATPFVPALRAMFPGARLFVLGTETSELLLRNLPVDGVYVVSRSFILRPWRMLALLRRLRAEKFDVAVEAGMGSFSGSLYGWLSGARYRIGVEGPASRLLNVRVPRPQVAHVRDRIPSFVRSLGAECDDTLIYRVAPEEADAATRLLRDATRADQALESGFLAVFVGGHLDKRVPNEQWVDIVACLDADGVRFVLLAGPEEHGLRKLLAVSHRLERHLLPPQSLRVVAAVLDRAALVVTTDSGPMHLAVALGRPTIALLERERSMRFRPRGPDDRALMKPGTDEVIDAVRRHPAWSSIAG